MELGRRDDPGEDGLSYHRKSRAVVSSEIWKFVVTDKDIVTNDLDLLRFRFITPEGVRFVGPGMRKVALKSFLGVARYFR